MEQWLEDADDILVVADSPDIRFTVLDTVPDTELNQNL